MVRCSYCGTALVIDDARVSTRREPPPRAEPEKVGPYPEPDVSLSTWEAPRLELSFLEQRIEGAPPEVFVGFELESQRFAFAYLRAVDAKGAPRPADLNPGLDALRASLEQDSDPGLAAHLAVEAMTKAGFSDRLELAALLFEPRQMRLVPYTAGCGGALVWASSEEGRSIVPTNHHPALEKKMLRESRDHFANGSTIHLAAHDLIVFASSGFLSRGGGGYASGERVLIDTLNDHLGEEPLRVVTLAKNGFWEDFNKHRRQNTHAPVGHVQLAAVRATLPPLSSGAFAPRRVETLKSRKFEVSLLVSPGDEVRQLPLHADRQVIVWASPREGTLPPGAFDAACTAVLAVLDRKDHGDNENPRQAGRDALAKLGIPPEQVRLNVIQLFDAWSRVKYFRHGWKQPLSLGPRGIKGDGMQQFDEGGEATVSEGHRLFFPGGARYEGQFGLVEQFAPAWNGGKASRLYEAFTEHWKTKRTPAALEKLVHALKSDQPDAELTGLALVTGVAPE